MKSAIAIFAAVLIGSGLDVHADTAGTTAESKRTVMTVDFRGRPPFKRRAEQVDVVDLARFETIPSAPAKASGTDFRGRPPFNRHGR